MRKWKDNISERELITMYKTKIDSRHFHWLGLIYKLHPFCYNEH